MKILVLGIVKSSFKNVLGIVKASLEILGIGIGKKTVVLLRSDLHACSWHVKNIMLPNGWVRYSNSYSTLLLVKNWFGASSYQN